MRIDKSMMIGVMAAFTFLFLCWLATEYQWTESFMRQRELTTKTSMQTSATKEVRWKIKTFEMKIALCFQENSLKYILAWTTRHGNRVAGKTSYLKCVSKNPRCVWTSDRWVVPLPLPNVQWWWCTQEIFWWCDKIWWHLVPRVGSSPEESPGWHAQIQTSQPALLPFQHGASHQDNASDLRYTQIWTLLPAFSQFHEWLLQHHHVLSKEVRHSEPLWIHCPSKWDNIQTECWWTKSSDLWLCQKECPHGRQISVPKWSSGYSVCVQL